MPRPTAQWTAAEIPKLDGKLAIVTGANSGLGLSTTRELARKGAKVILACRSERKAEAAIDELAAAGVARERLEFGACDLSSLASIRSFAEHVRDRHPHVDLLINNAGVMALPFGETADGFEMQFGTNHLGHFALTGLLLDRLLAAPEARVVTLSSLTHAYARMNFDDLHSRRGYIRWLAYGRSKLANLLFTFELQRRLEKHRHAAISIAAHPGYARTNLMAPTKSINALVERVISLGDRLVGQDADMGALPTLYAATAEEVRGGEFYGPGGLANVTGYPKRTQAMPQAYDRRAAERLWQVSVEQTGVDYEALDQARRTTSL
jgi:NAD(P)-dependent dehydrogenase (short-subunit alcohol dehydrogenase family)